MNKRPARTAKRGGFFSIEIAIAAAILALVIGGAISAFATADNSSTKQAARLAATTRAESLLAELSGHPITIATTTEIKTTDGWQTKVETKMIGNYHIQADITAGFSGSNFKPQTIAGYLLDSDASASYNHCPTSTLESWQNANLAGIAIIDTADPINTLATDVAIKDNFIFLTADSPTQAKPDFFSINILNLNQPQIAASLNTGPGLKTMHLIGDMVYAGNASVANQLQLIDVSDPVAPFLQSAFRLPGSYSTGDVQVTSIFYHKNKVYLGLKKSALSEFSIIDVSNKNSPQLLGQFEFDTTIHSIVVRGGEAFVDTASSTELTVLDITNPDDIKMASQFDAAGNSGSGKTLATWGTKLLLGRTVGNQELYLLDIADPKNIAELSKAETNATINKIITAGDKAILATNDNAADWQVWSTESNNLSLIKSLDLPEKAVGLTCGDHFIAAALASSTALAVIQIP